MEVHRSDATPPTDQHRLAQAVRQACIQAALAAYERAASDGLCEAGAWECAIEAIRALNLDPLLRNAGTK